MPELTFNTLFYLILGLLFVAVSAMLVTVYLSQGGSQTLGILLPFLKAHG